MLTRDDIIRKTYAPADLLDLLERFEKLTRAVSRWHVRTLQPGGVSNADENQLAKAYWEATT